MGNSNYAVGEHRQDMAREELDKYVADRLKGATMVFYGNNFSIAPQHFTVQNYYGEKYMEQQQRKGRLDEICRLCPEGKRLYMAIKDLELTKMTISLFKVVKEPADLGHIAAELVLHGAMTQEEVVTMDFIQRLLDGCHCFEKDSKGFTVDNIRTHIHHILKEKQKK